MSANTTHDTLVDVILSARWPDGSVDGFPTRRVAEHIAKQLLDDPRLTVLTDPPPSDPIAGPAGPQNGAQGPTGAAEGPALPAGWGYPTVAAKKAHWWDAGRGRSGCGKYGRFGIDTSPHAPAVEHACAPCRRTYLKARP